MFHLWTNSKLPACSRNAGPPNGGRTFRIEMSCAPRTMRSTGKKEQVRHYLEGVRIGEAKKLADKLGLPLAVLLDASLCLVEDQRNRNTQHISEATQLHNPDVAVAV